MEHERLKAALIELDWIRAREARLSQENAILLRGLARVQQSTRPERAIRSVLDGLCEDFVCDLATLIEFDTITGQARILLSSSRETEGAAWYPGRAIFDRSRCFVSLDPAITGLQWPEAFSRMNAMICIPTNRIGKNQEALACFSVDPGRFSSDQRNLLERIAFLTAQSAETLRLARRNAVLSAVVSGAGEEEEIQGGIAAEVQAGAATTLMRAQTIILESLIDLLDKPAEDSDASVQAALTRLGETLFLDAICLLSADGTGQARPVFRWETASRRGQDALPLPEISLPDLSVNGATLLSGQALQVEDCRSLDPNAPLGRMLAEGGVKSVLMVPLMEQGTVTGVAMFKSVRGLRVFTLAEIYLLQAFANLIASVAGKLRTEARLRSAQETLQRERNRLDAILSAMPDLVVEIGPDGRVVSLHSERIASMAEDPDAIIGTDPSTFLTPDAYQAYQAMCAELHASGAARNREVKALLRGMPYWFLLSASLCHSAGSGQRPGYIFVARNITEERARREEIEQLSMIARRTSSLVVLTGPDGRIVWVNSAFERRTGYDLEEVRGRRPGTLLQGALTDPETVARMRAAQEAGEGVQVRLVNYDRSGLPYWVEMDIQPTRNAAGEITGFMSVQTDINDQMQQIADLQKSERQARADRAAAMDASRDAIAITDDAGFYVYMNLAHRRMFGFDPDADIRAVSWHSLYEPDVIAAMEETVFPELHQRGSWQGELTGHTMTGVPLMQEVSLTLQEDGGIICITRDIGERIEAEAERARLREILQRAQRQEAVSQLAAGLAHDFNNLIASIAGSAVLIKDQSDPASAPHAARILTAAERAAELMQRVLDQGARRERKEQVDIRSLLEELADLVKSSLPRTVSLTVDCEDSGVGLVADPTDVLQVLLNLVINARDALGKGRPHPVIRLAGYPAAPADLSVRPQTGFLDPRRSYYVFEVTDNGSGMTGEVLQKIFEPYFTTKGDRGTGLGLIIVASIMEANAGAVFVRSAPGQGTSVRIFWPLSCARQVSGPASLPALPRPATAGDLRGVRILLAEDNAAFLEVLTAILDGAGATAAAFTNPVDALQAFQQNPSEWNLLITDFDMPEMNGAELAYNVRRLRPEIRVILVTALADWRSRLSESHQGDFFAVIPKPVPPADIIAQVKRALDREPA